MNEDLGLIKTGIITDENEQNYFVQIHGRTYALNKTEPAEQFSLGASLRGFCYENKHRQLKITEAIPDIKPGYYGWGTVVGVKHDLGVFLDIGLVDKDLAISLDELPAMKSLWPDTGDRLLVTMQFDAKHRLWGHLADDQIYKAISQPASKEKDQNQNVVATVINPKKMGTKVLTKNYQLGFIDRSELEQEPRLGQQLQARVIGVRPNKTLYLSLRPRAYEAISDDATMLLRMLEMSATHQLPYGDKSDAEQIKANLGISKGQFKRAVGNLLKKRLIEIEPNMLILKQQDDNDAGSN
ncbi:CvfB family protein [Fructilactobacillus florum]|uniref:S1 motif domain-containing protein n=1 Tax=Fructilactobacillus florum DSM 22689 = JCM 16035 TaxID=1423745 RepID=A0A0R2CTP5_9LACO|nr:S1-like domain-containing RNA-binding protein [Fructilactobacillus florum]KRM91436.1 hypothetical protein FC87_GL000947 [Fructilactobacillus florum DSM 22689 = JCM 16035]